MKILCGKEVNMSFCICYSSKKTNNIQPYIITLDLKDDLKDDIYKLYKVESDFKTRNGFNIPSNVFVLKCPQHTFGIIGFDETAIIIPIINNSTVYDISNIMTSRNIFIGIPSNILMEYQEN